MAKLEPPNIKPSRLAEDMGVHVRTINRRIQKRIIPGVSLGSGRFGITRTTYRTCLLYGLDAFRDETLINKALKTG